MLLILDGNSDHVAHVKISWCINLTKFNLEKPKPGYPAGYFRIKNKINTEILLNVIVFIKNCLVRS